MRGQFEKGLFEYLEQIKPGEDILIEYTSTEPAYLIVGEFFKYLTQRNVPVLVIDVLDHLHMLEAKLKLAGLDTSFLKDVYTIKVGGLVKIGNLLGEVSLADDVPVGFSKLDNFFKKVPESFVWRIILGLDKAISYHEGRGQLEVFMGFLRKSLGNEERVRVFTVNRDLVSERALNEVEEMVSRVFDLEFEAGRMFLTVVKSLDFMDYGVKLTVRATELQEYLRG